MQEKAIGDKAIQVASEQAADLLATYKNQINQTYLESDGKYWWQPTNQRRGNHDT